MRLCVVTLESIDINKNVVMKLVNPLVLNAPFTPPENIRKPYSFQMFSGSKERVDWEQFSS